MIARTRFRATVRIGESIAIVLFVARAAMGQPSDLVDTAALGARGVMIETAGVGRWGVFDVASLGDMDGDGFADFGVAGHQKPLVSPVLSIVFGRASFPADRRLGRDLENVAAFRVRDLDVTKSGWPAICPAGDLNHDGLSDVFFSLNNYRRTEEATPGVVFLVYGDPRLRSRDFFFSDIGNAVPGVVFWATSRDFSGIGRDVAILGDIDGDGKTDMAFSVFARTITQPEVRVLLGVEVEGKEEIDVGAIGGALPGFRLLLSEQGTADGVEGIGDFNGDGIGDFAVSDWDNVYIVLGRASFPEVIDLSDPLGRDGVVVIESPAIGSSLTFGRIGQVAGIGDLNGDGFDDVLIGSAVAWAQTIFGDPVRTSEAHILYGDDDFPPFIKFSEVPPEVGTRIVAGTPGFRNVAAAGDMNFDGIPDFLIGAPTVRVSGRGSAGIAYLVHGRRDFGAVLDLKQPFDGVQVKGHRSNAALGRVVSPAGDVNADGAPDFLVAATVETGKVDRGRVYLIYGTGEAESPLTLTGVEPEVGSVRGGTTVTLRGSGFGAQTEVFFGGRPAGGVTFVTASALRVVAPAAGQPGAVDVSVRAGGVTRTLAAGFVYTSPVPEIDLARPGRYGLRLEGDTEHLIGLSLAFGDFSGDGTDDLAVCSRESPRTWVVSLVLGGADLPEAAPLFAGSGFSQIVLTNHLGTHSANGKVASIGDVNGDGVLDLGANFHSDSLDGFVVLGGSHLEDADLTVEELVADEEAFRLVPGVLGGVGPFSEMSFARVGDITEDGIEDLVLALSFAARSPGQILFLEGRREWPQALDLSSESGIFARITGPNAWFANRLVAVGDVNGDGYGDLLANGSTSEDNARCYLIYSHPGLPSDVSVTQLVADGGAVEFLRVDREFNGFLDVSRAGDVNADGYADFLISDHNGGVGWRGVTFLIRGGPDLPSRVDLPSHPESPDGVLRVFGPGDLANSGMSVSPAGDFNGDGYDDFFLGALEPGDPFTPVHFYVIYGDEELSSPIDLSRLRGRGVDLRGVSAPVFPLGSLHETGDLNADGRPDFAFSEHPVPPPPGADSTGGAVTVLFGLPRSGSFIRGDANDDGSPNLSDVVFILSYLFNGEKVPRCLDAADTDDDGGINIADGVYLLGHLFQAGAPPPPLPFPEAGSDPTEDGLDCQG